jgi:hypothetical protein
VLGGFSFCSFTLADDKKAADTSKQAIAPVIEFGTEERTVSIKYGKQAWTFRRPVVSDWAYKTEGHTYWVASDGDDRKDGTKEKPFKTIGKAVAKAGAGDIVYIRAGTYVEPVLLKKSGAEGKPLVISCAPGELGKVKVTLPKEYVEKNPGEAVVTLDNVHHVWINGLVVEGPKGRPEAPASETYGANGITWRAKAGLGCRATNNVVYSCMHCGLKEMGHGGTDILMEGNVIFENGTEGKDHGIYIPGESVTINGNIIFNNAGYGIHSYGDNTKRHTITRNVIFGHKESAGIILCGGSSKVFNNVCTGNFWGIYYRGGECKKNVVKNNIFALNSNADCIWDNGGELGDPKDNDDDYNCYFPGKPSENIPPGKHEVLADPRFLDPKKGDYRLKEDSPCKGKGVDVGLPFEGKKPNLGAF